MIARRKAEQIECNCPGQCLCHDIYDLPKVGGRLERTVSALERAALIYVMREQEKLSPDNALIAVLCDTVRLCREQRP